jgi:hypothetical protein
MQIQQWFQFWSNLLTGKFPAAVVGVRISHGACKWEQKRAPLMSAKLSIGDLMATETHVSDTCTKAQL